VAKKKSISGKAFDWDILKRIYSFTAPYKKAFYISIALTLIVAALSFLRPLLTQFTIDRYIAFADPKGLLNMCVLMMVLLFIQSVIQYYHSYLTSWLGQVVIRDMRVQLFRHIINFRLKYFDHTPIGTLVTRTVSDLETVADIFSEGLIVIIGDILTLFVIILYMFITDWRLTLISLSTIPLLMWATNIFKNGIKEAFREVRTAVAALNTFVQEHLTGMSIVQIFNREETEMEKFKAINKDHRRANIKSIWYYSVFFPVVEILSSASIGLLVWWGAKGAINGQVSPGSIVAFIMCINMLFRPIRELADKFNTLQLGMVSSERIFKVFDTDAVIENKGTLIPKDIKGKIEFRNVWFAYNTDGSGKLEDGSGKTGDGSSEEWVIKNVSFSIEPGKTLALGGGSIIDKSSIIAVMNSFYEFSKGEILLDDIDIRAYELKALRSNVALVMQDVFLFSDTIANNISLKDPHITRQEIIAAAHAVGAHRFIERLPGGYDYHVGERGGVLSVGQRQLIAFIRAYVFNPKILILDEATSSIDSESEELIQSATSKLTQNRTSIIIAHRLATIQNADKILVMDHGEVKEQGTHQELLKQGGLYKNLYEIQFAGDEV